MREVPQQATSVTPIVFAFTLDPVGAGLVASLVRPGGNVTGLSVQSADFAGKQLELLRELVPSFCRLGGPSRTAEAPAPRGRRPRSRRPPVRSGRHTLTVCGMEWPKDCSKGSEKNV
jgi:ABC transporter substrate binding protein